MKKVVELQEKNIKGEEYVSDKQKIDKSLIEIDPQINKLEIPLVQILIDWEEVTKKFVGDFAKNYSI